MNYILDVPKKLFLWDKHEQKIILNELFINMDLRDFAAANFKNATHLWGIAALMENRRFYKQFSCLEK